MAIELVAATPNENTFENEVKDYVATLKDYSISNAQDYQSAADVIKEIKNRTAQIKEFFAPLKDAAHKAHKSICGRENEILKPLDTAEKLVRTKMNEYVAEQERARAEAEARARAEAQEEVERLMQEAENNPDEAEALLEAASMMEAAANNMAISAEAISADGVSMVTDYEIVVKDATRVPVNVAGVEIRPIDMAAVKRLVKASHGTIKIDGIEIRETKAVRVRR